MVYKTHAVTGVLGREKHVMRQAQMCESGMPSAELQPPPLQRCMLGQVEKAEKSKRVVSSRRYGTAPAQQNRHGVKVGRSTDGKAGGPKCRQEAQEGSAGRASTGTCQASSTEKRGRADRGAAAMPFQRTQKVLCRHIGSRPLPPFLLSLLPPSPSSSSLLFLFSLMPAHFSAYRQKKRFIGYSIGHEMQ